MSRGNVIKTIGAIQSIWGSLLFMLTMLRPPSPADQAGPIFFLMIATGILSIRFVQGERRKTIPLTANLVLLLVQIVATVASVRLGRTAMEIAGIALAALPFLANTILIWLHEPVKLEQPPESSTAQ